MLAQKRNKIMYKNVFQFFFISNKTLDPPTHFQSLFGFLEFFFIYMAPYSNKKKKKSGCSLIRANTSFYDVFKDKQPLPDFIYMTFGDVLVGH